MKKKFELKGKQISRHLVHADGQWRTKALFNGHTNSYVETEGEEFSIEVEGKGWLGSDMFKVKQISPGKDSLQVELIHQCGLKAVLSYGVDQTGYVLRKVMNFSTVGGASLLVRRINLEPLKLLKQSWQYPFDSQEIKELSDADATSPNEATGQPAATNEFFFGVEFPTFYAYPDEKGYLHLDIYPGKKVTPQTKLILPPVVIGATPMGQMKIFFDRYLRTLRPFKEKSRLVSRQDFWMDVEPTYEALLDQLDYAHRHMGKKYNFMPDTVSFNWLCGLRHPKQYRLDGYMLPKDATLHTRSSQTVKKYGVRYGIYFNPTAYGWDEHYILDWACKQGLAIASYKEHGREKPMGLCLGHKETREVVFNRILEDAKKYNLGEVVYDMIFKGSGWDCMAEGHNHLPGSGGRFGTYAVAEALCELSERLRRVVPDISINTMAFHLQHSPWWLKWLDGCHGIAGDNEICYKVYAPRIRDARVDEISFLAYDYYQQRKRWLPIWGNDTFMGLQVRREFIEYNFLPEYEDHTKKWEDELVMGIAGHFCQSHISGVDYKILNETPSGLAFYSRVMKWAKNYAYWLLDTEMIGGDPEKGELVGWVHRDAKEGTILTLRNCMLKDQVFDLKLTKDIIWTDDNTSMALAIIYPYRQDVLSDLRIGSHVAIPVGAHESVVAVLLPYSTWPGEFIEGWRRDDEKGLLYKPVKSFQPSWRVSNLNVSENLIEGEVVIDIPPNTEKATLQIYFQPHFKDSVLYVEAERVEGETNVHRIYRRTRFGNEPMCKHCWAFVTLKSGVNTIKFRTPQSGGRGSKLGIWLEGEVLLSPKKIASNLPKGVLDFPTLYNNKQFFYFTILEPK
jgi:hypothetical protein